MNQKQSIIYAESSPIMRPYLQSKAKAYRFIIVL